MRLARHEQSPGFKCVKGDATRSSGEPSACWLRLLSVLLLFASGCASVQPRGDVDVGFAFSRDTSPDGAARCRAAGPLYESQDTGTGQQFTGIRPFYSQTVDTAQDRRLHEVLWPVASVKHFKGETDWHFLLAYGHDFDNEDEASRYRAMIFPLVYWGRDKENESYFSIFPLGGTLNEFVGRDRIIFALFPLYAYSYVGNTETWDYLWPIVSRTKGDDVSRFRVWPLYGKSVSDNKWTKQFVLWPIWNHARYYYPGHEGTSYILFPLFGRTHTKDQKGWMVVPPFFRWAKSEKRTMLNCPWPFIQYASGDQEKLYIWPLWGRRDYQGIRSSFLLWPFVRTSHVERSHETRDRLAIFPFIHHERVSAARVTETGEQTDKAANVKARARYFKLWPLLSYRREGDVSRFRLLAVWPEMQTPQIERNWAPLWTLYSRVATPEQLEHELLWGLFRYRREGTESRHVSIFPLFSTSRCDADARRRRWSILLGLLGHEQEDDRSTWRVLWFLKFGG